MTHSNGRIVNENPSSLVTTFKKLKVVAVPIEITTEEAEAQIVHLMEWVAAHKKKSVDLKSKG
ncbi:hypothetical protein AMTR_s00027p00248590 [Amborella trichopoda]|uniref:Uncharacterized protein n=1 Tax=Amborella trichopoda TaxID=13333 RepID=W1PU90_AMBTC|nr:hypothetical protein AMTR_s00027p00248590 [Amborella trichopoda]